MRSISRSQKEVTTPENVYKIVFKEYILQCDLKLDLITPKLCLLEPVVCLKTVYMFASCNQNYS